MNPCKTCTKKCKYVLYVQCPDWQKWAEKINKEKEDTSLEEEEITISL